MAVILKIVDNPRTPITVDSTLIFADSTDITADTSSIATTVNYFSIIITPKYLVEQVKIELFDELLETNTNFLCFAENFKGKMRLSFTFLVKENSSYEMTVRDLDNKVIWRGKAFTTKQNDVQNFEFGNANKVNNIIKL